MMNHTTIRIEKSLHERIKALCAGKKILYKFVEDILSKEVSKIEKENEKEGGI